MSDAAIDKLSLMTDGPFPGRRDVKDNFPTDNANEGVTTKRKTKHQLVCTNRRNARTAQESAFHLLFFAADE